MCSALVSHFACFGTLVQIARCVSNVWLLVLTRRACTIYAIYNIKQGVGELFDANKVIVATNGFVKKQQKTPRSEILVAMQRRAEYFNRKIGL